MRNKRCIESWLDCQTIQYGMTSESVRHVKIWQVKQFNCKKTSRRYVTKIPIYIKGIHYIICVKKIWILLTIRVQKVYWVHGLSNLWFIGLRTIGSMALEPSILLHGIWDKEKGLPIIKKKPRQSHPNYSTRIDHILFNEKVCWHKLQIMLA